MSYYRGPPQPQRGRYDYSNGSHPNANPYQQPGQWRDDRNYYAGGRPQQPYVQPQQQPRPPPQQQPRPQPQRYSRPSPPPKTPRTEAREILDDVRSSKEQRARAFKVLLDDARATPHSTRSVSSLTSAFHLFASDQQEEVIDFVYDLCEDPEQGVRIQGYRTIVELSKAVPSWTRRNADVLVQLLQSDSQTELRVIRDALVSHIRTDPVAAIEVITEHMARAGEVEDKSAQPLTGGMKRLVLDFLMTADVAKARGEKLVAASDAEASFNQGVSEALLYSTRSDAKELLSLIQTLPSWTSQSQPNQFRTQSISSLLERVITLTHKLEAAAAEDALALFILAQDAAAGGNGDPRAFLRFWARMAWSDWTVAEQYEYGRAESILRWLKASMLVWKDVHREQKDDVAAFEESSLTRDVSAAVTVLFLSAAGTFEKAGAANQEKMWAFVDTTLAIFSRLCQTRMDLSALRDTFLSEPVRKMLRFAYETKDARGSGLSPDSMRLLNSIVSKCKVVYDDLRLQPPAPDGRPPPHRIPDSSPTAGLKRNAEGLQITGNVAKRPPVKIDRDRPGKEKQEPPKGPLAVMRNHLRASEASPISRQELLPPRRSDLPTAPKADSLSDERPLKRPKLSLETSAVKPARALSLLERIDGGKQQSRPNPSNGTHRSGSDLSQPRSLAERLGVNINPGSTQSTNPDDAISIRGAAGLLSRLDKPATPTTLLSRIGSQAEGNGSSGGPRVGRK